MLSGRIVVIDIEPTDAKAACHVGAYRLDTVAFRGVMAGGEVGNAALACNMGRLFRNLAAEVEVTSCGNRVLEIALRATGAPTDATDLSVHVADFQRRAAQNRADDARKFTSRDRRRQVSEKADLLVTEAGVGMQSETLAELRVVAKFGVRVERQVIGKHTDFIA